MKKLCLLLTTLLVGSISAQAVLISVSGAANSTARGSSDLGTFAATTLVGDNTAPPGTLIYTISGLTLDGTGTANDSVVIEFIVTTDGQNIQTSGTTAAGWLSSGGNTIDANGEFVQIDFVSISVNLNGDTGNGAGTWEGFTAVSFGSWGSGHISQVNGISQAYIDGSANKVTDLTGGGNDTNFKAWFDTAANTGAGSNAAGSWRPEGWSFQIEAVAAPPSIGNPTAWPTNILENAPQASADSMGISNGTQVGQSFTLSNDSEIDTVLVQLDDGVAATDLVGSLTLEIVAANSGLPTNAVLASFTGELPTGLGTGSYLEFDLPGTLSLAAGDYAFTIATSDADLSFNSTTNNLLATGSLIKNSGSGWVEATPAGRDLIFALTGSVTLPFTLDNPAVWPTTILEVAPQTTAQSNSVAAGSPARQLLTLSGMTTLDSVLVQLDDGTPSSDLEGSLTMELFADDGAGQPTGSARASLTGLLPAGLGTSSFIEFILPSSVILAQGDYVLILSSSDADLLLNATATDVVFGLTGFIDGPRPPASNGPNVVFVLVDDWGWTDHSSAAMALGHQSPYYQTPNFERLVNAGVAFTSAYAQPNCAPTRAALLSGQYSCRHGNGVYNVGGLNRGGNRTIYTTPADQGDEHANGDEQTITIAEAFVNSGYVTAHFGKFHAGSSDTSDPTAVLNQGFDFNYGGSNAGNPGNYFAQSHAFASKLGPGLDVFATDYTSAYITDNLIPYNNGNDPTTLNGTAKHLTDAMADAFVSFMDNHQSGAMSSYPIYAQLHFYAVHGPIRSRPDLLTKYNGITPPPGSNHTMAKYAGLIEGMDHSLGRVMDYLSDPNGDGDTADSIAENTLLIFCSDNGGDTGNNSNLPLRYKKGTHFEGGIRVPCVVSMPGTIPTNTVSESLVHVVDFYPTMLDFAGGVFPNSVTHPLDGVSLHDHLLDPDHTARNRGPVFYHFPGYMDGRAYACSVVIKNVEGKRYKYIYSYDPYYDPSHTYDQHQLYCLTDDIGETVNLLDYIDIENPSDPDDPSTTEEYWNYILYKGIGDQMATALNSWLDHGTPNPSDPADATWNPLHVTYKSNFPGIAPELVGQTVAMPPAILPELTIPEGEIFRVLNASENMTANEVTLEFRSDAGFNYAIEASSNLVDWVEIVPNIVGQADSTTHVASDPAISTADSRFYRAILKNN